MLHFFWWLIVNISAYFVWTSFMITIGGLKRNPKTNKPTLNGISRSSYFIGLCSVIIFANIKFV